MAEIDRYQLSSMVIQRIPPSTKMLGTRAFWISDFFFLSISNICIYIMNDLGEGPKLKKEICVPPIYLRHVAER